MTEECDHRFVRVFTSDINRHHRGSDEVVCVVCQHCGKSPIETLNQRAASVSVVGDWPDHLRITNFFWDEAKGPSVEYERRSDGGDT